MSHPVWRVAGGKKDGILVRTGKSIKSPEADGRLGFGALIEEVELDGDRLHYRLLQGSGPEAGWVSLRVKGQDIVAPASAKILESKEEAELRRGQVAQRAWPEDASERLRATLELRSAAPLPQDLGDAVVDLRVHGPAGTDALRVELAGGACSLRGAEEGGAPAVTVEVKHSTLAKLFAGVINVETCLEQHKMRLIPEISGDDLLKLVLLLTHVLTLEGAASLAGDGVRRPVPLEAGGLPPPALHPQLTDAPPPPDWLLPDGIPEKKRRILFLSIPWSGHIIHLRRIAAWFLEHAVYEVHFACMSEQAPELPDGLKVYCAEPHEMTDMFDVLQARMRESAMRSPVEKEGTTPEGAGDDVFGDTGELIARDSHKLLCWLVRVMLTVRPSIIVADSCFCMGAVHKFGALFGNVRTLFINSPGIMEERLVEGDLPPLSVLASMAFAAATTDATAPSQPPAGGMGFDDMFVGGPPTMEDVLQSGGKIDLEKVNPKWQPMFKIPGFNFTTLMRIGDAIAKENPALEPINVYPSSSWMVEVQPDKEVFSCPLLPLPMPVGGSVKVGRSALKFCLDAELLDWLFSERLQDPVVYVAFGTIVKGFKATVQRVFEALDGGPWRVLWALPRELQEHLPGGLDRDRWRVEHFVNQRDVLRCERVRCFLSHCGMNSTTEAMACGVPMVCHPFFMDQYEWARTVRSRLRAGIEVHKSMSDAAAVRGAVAEVLGDPMYAANAKAVARRLRDQHECIKQRLGPAMVPRGNLGPGVMVVAAYMLCLLKGKDPGFVVTTVNATV